MTAFLVKGRGIKAQKRKKTRSHRTPIPSFVFSLHILAMCEHRLVFKTLSVALGHAQPRSTNEYPHATCPVLPVLFPGDFVLTTCISPTPYTGKYWYSHFID